jgi:hypothetical protein
MMDGAAAFIKSMSKKKENGTVIVLPWIDSWHPTLTVVVSKAWAYARNKRDKQLH